MERKNIKTILLNKYSLLIAIAVIFAMAFVGMGIN